MEFEKRDEIPRRLCGALPVEIIEVKASKHYYVYIGEGILEQAGKICYDLGIKRAFIIADEIPYRLYSTVLENSLTQSGIELHTSLLTGGEGIKTPEKAFELANALASLHFTRSDAVLAFGGGTVGDLAGFTAASYLRGIRLVQIPTTLLAAVDASVGGKTAVHLPAGKNLLGAFYQPDAVICDTKTLDSLPDNIFADGCAEMIKHGVIADKTLFDQLKQPFRRNITHIVTNNVQIKRKFVLADEKDKGLRQMLNFGHTAGHAVEKCSHYDIPHGSAVAIGMVISARAAIKKGIADKTVLEEIIAVLQANNLPTKCPYTADQLYEIALVDKKREGGRINYIFPTKIGEAIAVSMDMDGLREVLRLGREE